MGPVEKAIRAVIEGSLERIEAQSGISQADPRFPLAGIGTLLDSYQAEVRMGEVPVEVAQDYLNAVYAVLGAHSMTTLERGL